MTILDTFYLLFKNDASSSKKDIEVLDKQLDEFEKKGKKRDDAENKRYQELKKQRKDLLDQTKEQQRETDKLGDSFTRMIEGAIGAATAYASFGALKNGLIDANKLNASLAVLQKTTGQNAGEVKVYGAALEAAGGQAQDLYNFISGQANFAAQNRTPLPPTGEYLSRLHNQVKNKSPQEALTYLQQIPGAVALAPLLELPDKEFEAAVASGHETTKLRDEDTKAALENQEAYAKTKQAFGQLATEIDTNLLGTIKKLNQAFLGLANYFQGSPNASLGSAVGIAGVTSIASGWAALKAVKLVGGLFGLGGANAGAAAAGAGAAAVGGVGAAGILGALGAGISATWGAEAVGGWIGRKLRKTSPVPVTSDAGSPRQKIESFWRSQGYSEGAAAGWTANAQAESSFDPAARNGSHGGIYQWSAARRARILAATNIDVWNSGLPDQLRGAAWEANAMGLTPGKIPGEAGQAAAFISNNFEIPSTTSAGLTSEAAHRAQIAQGYTNIPAPQNAAAGTIPGGKTISIKIDDIKIETQATDATGIAREVGVELTNQIRMAMSNFDDGVNA